MINQQEIKFYTCIQTGKKYTELKNCPSCFNFISSSIIELDKNIVLNSIFCPSCKKLFIRNDYLWNG